MKKAIFASMLAAAAIAVAPYSAAVQAAQPAAGGQASSSGQAAGGQVQLSPPEFDAYNKVQTASDPASKASAAEAFLQQFPQSSVKSAVLQQLAVGLARKPYLQRCRQHV